MQAAGAKEREEQRKKQDSQISASLARIKNTILVMSGKGGVGKSCIAVNVAAALAEQGLKVGLMDVDLHGPSIPQMLGIPNMNEARTGAASPAKGITFADGKIIPARVSENLSVVSIECMLESNDTAVIWRGPLKIGAIRQFISDVAWEDLDYLVIDSPPGTGDEPLTVAQTVPGAGALIVTTPQAVSLRDVRKSIRFCREVNMKVLGLVENMSGFVCPSCGAKIDLFKVGGGERVANETEVPFLGRIPIIADVVDACDRGVPAITVSEPLREAVEGVVRALGGGSPQPSAPAAESKPTGTGRARIAVPLAEGKLAMHFGHCQEFALVDVDEEKRAITGKELAAPPAHEPGALPRWLHEKGATVIIAGGMGSRAQALFAEKGIRVVTGAPAADAERIVADYLNGTLATGDNVCDH
jgi:Mrp family chromosome partitioning ATPase/predicted Fe-Mo cluster-binding NifX family protein